MKKFIPFLVLMCSILLFGCDFVANEKKDSKESIAYTVEKETSTSKKTKDLNTNQVDEINTVEKDIDFENILSIAEEFTKDVIHEEFDQLITAYPYSEGMDKILESEETRKNIIFHNMELGEIEEIQKAYTLAYGSQNFVMVPIKASVQNINFQITFDKDKNIIGFSYEDYKENPSTKEKDMPEGIVEEEYSFYNDNHVIPGTLTTPTKSTNYPLVIFVHGAGPSDRDLSIYQNKPFRDIAWGLAQRGIASYRYDKRTYLHEEETKNDTSLTTYEETINDAVAAAYMAMELKDIDPAKVYILGHSQGGYLMPRIAELYQPAAGYILMSSPAEHIKNYLREQYEYLAMEDEVITVEEQANITEVEKELALLNRVYEIPENQKVLGFYKNYWVELDQYMPTSTAGKINVPILVLQGERDYQVTMKQFNLWKSFFEASPNWTFRSYKGLNHFMIKGEGNSYSQEYSLKNYVDEQVIQDIVDFILGE